MTAAFLEVTRVKSGWATSRKGGFQSSCPSSPGWCLREADFGCFLLCVDSPGSGRGHKKVVVVETQEGSKSASASKSKTAAGPSASKAAGVVSEIRMVLEHAHTYTLLSFS